MKMTVSKSMFRDAFERMDRKNNFSYEGLGVLFDFLDDVHPDMELDVIGLCCDFSEGKIEDILKEYSMESLEELRDSTTVLEVDSETIIYGAF